MEPTIYLFFNGNCLEAMNFYATVFGGTIEGIFHNKDAPDAESRMPGGDDLVMNMSMKLGSARLMASDSGEGWYQKPQGFAVSMDASSLVEFDRIHALLAKDALAITMPASETFWAERFAMLTDRFGTPWMLGFTGSKAQG